MLIDAKDAIVGRLATVVAKKALLGEKIEIVNSEEAVITGKKKYLIELHKQKKERGTFKGPFHPRIPERFLKRVIRGMLPYKLPKGREAFDRIKCYIGVPKDFEGQEIIKIDNANYSRLKNLNYLRVKDICKKLGGKYE